jgi:hypothetical protein
MSTPFELWSLPDRRLKGRLFLMRLPFPARHVESVLAPTAAVTIQGALLDVAWGQIRALVELGGAPLGEAFLTERSAAPVSEEAALRLLLAVEASESARGEEKLRVIEQIAEMQEDTAAFMVREILSGDERRAARGRRMLKAYVTDAP